MSINTVNHSFALKNRAENDRTKRLITAFKGKVVYGNQIGRTIGFPTANLFVDRGKPFLKKGVYGVQVSVGNKQYTGVMNVGTRPTIEERNSGLHYEIHILGFNQMIYGQILRVDVCFFVREEMKFNSLDQLVEQIKKDVDFVQKDFEEESQ